MMKQVEGTIESMSRAFSGGWRTAKVREIGTVVGHFPQDVGVGDYCTFQGVFIEHPKYGRQLKAESVRKEIPRDVMGILSYLDHKFKWIGPTVARALVEEFGERLFSVIEESPQDLARIRGVTQERAQTIHDEYMAVKSDRELDLFFSTHGISTALMNRLLDEYRDKKTAIKVIKENPYQLADEVWGVGFKKADSIARSLGILTDSPMRTRAGVAWILDEAGSGEGHTCLPMDELVHRAAKVLEGSWETVEATVKEMIARENLVEDAGFVYLPGYFDAEVRVSEKLRALAGAHHRVMLSELTDADIADMDEDQKKALEYSLKSKILIVTGGPGCLSGDVAIKISRRSNKNTPRTYSLRDAYHKFNGIKQRIKRGSGKNKMWDRSLPTMVLSMEGNDFLIYNEVEEIIFSGNKEVFRVRTESGKEIEVTKDHAFKIPSGGLDDDLGFLPLDKLSIGDSVMCENGSYSSGGRKRPSSHNRKVEYVIPYHPMAAKSFAWKKDYKRCHYARLVVEASMNNMSVDDFINVVRFNEGNLAPSLTYLPLSKSVHHKDHDPSNDSLDNLEVIDHVEHCRIHGYENAKNFGNNRAKLEKIVSIEFLGIKDTYDIVMKDPYRNFLANGFVVHNCGKTWTINKIIQAIGRSSAVYLAAPTGKAAKRMKEATRLEAKTIHRLLKFSPFQGGFQRDAHNPLSSGTIIIDETSMIDIRLMNSLLDAIVPEKHQLIFVGDVDQLPSVGPGRVLADMIDSGSLPVVRLRTLHRQAAKSYINRNAQRINRGESIELPSSDCDFLMVPEADKEAIPALIVKVCERFAGHYGFTFDQIQILAPQKKGPAGVIELNKQLRPALNPEGAKLSGTSFLSGDRVIQMRNNYDLEVFNGDIGKVIGLAEERDNLLIGFDDGDRTVVYPLSKSEDLQLAYALTVHKSQGSEFPVVVMPIHTTNHIMLRRNLFYTAVTRARKFMVLVGTMKAVQVATKTVDSSTRYSNLKKRLLNNGHDVLETPVSRFVSECEASR